MNISPFIPEIIPFDSPVEAVRDIRRMARAKKRHDDVVHIRRNKNLWFNQNHWANTPDENGDYSTWNKGVVKHNAQNGRFDRAIKRHKKNPVKHLYNSPAIDLANYFDEIDAKEEERYVERSDDFAKWLIQQDEIDLKAGELLEEYEEFIYNNDMKARILTFKNNCVPYVDYNYPGVVYFVEPECIRAFCAHMEEHGAIPVVDTNWEPDWTIEHVVGVRTHRNPGLIVE